MRFLCNYSCDCGALKIGNKDFSIHISNDFGDGYFKVFMLDKKDIYRYPFVLSFQGTGIKIFDYDCSGGKPIEGIELTGSFMAYAKDGNIYFEKLDDSPNYWGDNV